MLRRALFPFTLAALVTASPVFADEDGERRKAFAEGRTAIEAQRWSEALKIYQDLWAQRRTYDVALQLGLIELNLKRYRDSAEHLSYGLRNLPPKEPPSTAERARKLLEVSAREVTAVQILVDRTDAQILIDGVPIGRSPLDGEAYVEPGKRRITAAVDGQASVQKTIVAKPGEAQRVVLELAKNSSTAEPAAVTPPEPPPAAPPEPPPPAPAAPPEPSKNLTPVYIAGAAAVAAIGAGAGFLIVGANKDADKEDLLQQFPQDQPCANNTIYPEPCAEIDDLAAEARTFRAVGFVALGVGIAAAGTAVYLFTQAEPRRTARTAPTPKPRLRWLAAPIVGSHELGAVLRAHY